VVRGEGDTLRFSHAGIGVLFTPPTFRTLVFIWAYEHRQLEAGDIWARGNWCVVRRAIASGKLIAYEMGDGDRLTVGGRKVIG